MQIILLVVLRFQILQKVRDAFNKFPDFFRTAI